MGLVLFPQGRVEHEAEYAIGNSQQQEQENEQDDEDKHRDLRAVCYLKYIEVYSVFARNAR